MSSEEPVEEPQIPVEEHVVEPAVEEPEVPVVEPAVEEPAVEEPAVEEPEVPVEVPVVEPVEEPEVPVEEPVEEPVKEPEVPVEEPAVEEPAVEEPEVPVEEPVEEPVKEPAPTEEENITMAIEEDEPSVPKLIFIVPYRDREQHYRIFTETMNKYLTVDNPQGLYRILYIHQTDKRGFNRGAMKNIGFLTVKHYYPNDYQNMTLVFNDIDSIPAPDAAIQFETVPGTIKHFYGFTYTLGGMVSVVGSDFEKLNGFPNFWSWGFEDNLFQMRAEDAGIKIDRSVFYPINDPHIIRLSETPFRTVNKSEYSRFENKTTEGIYSISGLNCRLNESTGFVDVLNFNTTAAENVFNRVDYDIRNGPAPFKNVISRISSRNPKMAMNFL